jgi:hypothetical protein
MFNEKVEAFVCYEKNGYICRKIYSMVTVKITLEDRSMLSALRSVLSRLKGVTNVSVVKNDVSSSATLAAMKELNIGKGVRCKSVDELFEKLDA